MLRVWLIDGGARQSDPGDCDDDDLQCGMILFFSLSTTILFCQEREREPTRYTKAYFV